MANLTLDPIRVETDLAEKYLKKYNNFENWPLTGKFWHIKKYPDEKDEYDIGELLEDKKDLEDQKLTSFPSALLARQIAKEIKAQESIFYQLEYLLRKTDRDDVKNNINLISQHLQSCRESWNSTFNVKINILMDEETPLYALGCVAIAISHNNIMVEIVTTKKMAPICNLFTELCAQFGWQIPLIFVNNTREYCDGVVDSGKIIDINQITRVNIVIKDGACRCTGVVTESADIDSALDIFINSSVTAPWKLERIFVQESVYDEVKCALSSKCTLERVDSCADAFATKGKIFLCDTFSTETGGGDRARVHVEAYRTVKELCVLLERSPTPCLSLWAADSQISHEVALKASVSFAWFNDYARFDGPPLASLPVYEIIYPRFTQIINKELLKQISELWKAWKKLSKNERIDLIMRILASTLYTNSDKSKRYEHLPDLMLNWHNDCFMSVDNGRICFSVEVPSKVDDITFIDMTNKDFLVNSIMATISGSAVVYIPSKCLLDEPVEIQILRSLQIAGVPVMKWEVNEPTENIKVSLVKKKLKVISTNFGTIFAN